MKLDEECLRNLQHTISELKSNNKFDDIYLIEDFLDIVEYNLSENYKFLGTDCYKKHDIYRFQAYIDGKTPKIKSDMIDFLCSYPDKIGNAISVSYHNGFRIVLTMNLNAD